jgi:hypothetical protein
VNYPVDHAGLGIRRYRKEKPSTKGENDMKKLKWMLCCGLCALTGTVFAQANYGLPASSTTDTSQETKESGQSQKFCPAKDLVGANVKDSQGEKLGDINEVFINTRSGEAVAAIDIGDNRHAIVPVQALQVAPARGMLRNAEVTLSKSKQEVQSAPTVTEKNWQNLDNASFIQKVYSQYKIQQPSAMGSAGADSMGGTSSGADSSKPKKNKDQ